MDVLDAQKPRPTHPPGLDAEVKVRSALALFGHEGALGAERDGQDALVLGSVESRGTQPLCLTERDRLPVERSLNARVLHVNRETEARHGIPVIDHANLPEVEARIAPTIALQNDVLSRGTTPSAEQVAVDHRVVVADLSIVAVHTGRDVGQPEVFIAGTRRPGSRQLKLTAVDEDAIGEHAQRDLVVSAEQARAAHAGAGRISGRADAIAEVATEVVARTGPGRLDVDTRQ